MTAVDSSARTRRLASAAEKFLQLHSAADAATPSTDSVLYGSCLARSCPCDIPTCSCGGSSCESCTSCSGSFCPGYSSSFSSDGEFVAVEGRALPPASQPVASTLPTRPGGGFETNKDRSSPQQPPRSLPISSDGEFATVLPRPREESPPKPREADLRIRTPREVYEASSNGVGTVYRQCPQSIALAQQPPPPSRPASRLPARGLAASRPSTPAPPSAAHRAASRHGRAARSGSLGVQSS